MSKTAYVVMAHGKVFAGISSISGRPMWFDCGDDMSHAGDLEAIRFRRHSAWLEMAQASEPSARWLICRERNTSHDARHFHPRLPDCRPVDI